MRLLKRSVLILLLAGLGGQAYAAQNDGMDETAMLPAYCPYTFGGKGTDAEGKNYWRQRLGPELSHMHHYCNGLRLINRARISVARERAKWYNASIGEIDYVLRHASDNYVLMPEFLTRRGEALIHVNRLAEAEQSLRKAIGLKPDYWPAYAMLAQRFLASKDTDDARDVLKKGLSQVKDPRALQRMLDDINQRRQ